MEEERERGREGQQKRERGREGVRGGGQEREGERGEKGGREGREGNTCRSEGGGKVRDMRKGEKQEYATVNMDTHHYLSNHAKRYTHIHGTNTHLTPSH